MTAQPYDLVIRGGTVGTAGGTFEADVAIRGETIVALGQGLASGTREIDATGKLVPAAWTRMLISSRSRLADC